MNELLKINNASGVSLDLFCLNCECFTLVILSPHDKAITLLKCSKCHEPMMLIQVCNTNLAKAISRE